MMIPAVEVGEDYAHKHTTWISVKDRLPELEDWVLAYGDLDEETRDIAVVNFLYNDHLKQYFWNLLSSGCGCCDKDLKNVTHWMPLPEPPNE